MTAPAVPCPVCGRRLPPDTRGRVPWHRYHAPQYERAFGTTAKCPGSGAFAPAGDLFTDAPTVPALPAPAAQGSLFTDSRED